MDLKTARARLTERLDDVNARLAGARHDDDKRALLWERHGMLSLAFALGLIDGDAYDALDSAPIASVRARGAMQ